MRSMMVIVLLGLIGLTAEAQRVDRPLWTSTSQNSTVGLYGYGSVVSNAVQTSFVNELTQSDLLSREARSTQSGRLNEDINRIGGDYIIGLQGAFALKEGLQLNYSFTDEAFGEAMFSKDMFDLAFFGNKAFAGDSVAFDNAFGRAGRFQKMGFGLSFSPTLSTQYGFMLSFVNGESVGSVNIVDGWLYTSELGDTVSAGMLGQLFYSDTGNTGFMAHNGAGAMIDLYLAQDFEAWNSTWKASVLLMNLGMVQWRPNTERYTSDTTITFTGITISDFGNVQSDVNGASLEDSLMGGIREGFSKGPVNQVLPGWVQMEIAQQKELGFVMAVGFTARLQSLARVYGHVLPGYRFNEHFGANAELGYGGFGGFQAGVGGYYQSSKWKAQLRVSNLEAYLMPKSFSGITLAGGVQYFFDL